MMRKILVFLIWICCSGAQAAEFEQGANFSVCFTPGQNCTAYIIGAIDSAVDSILVQSYSFTSKPIMNALIAAKQRGALVRVVLDKAQTIKPAYSAKYLTRAGVPVWIDNKVDIAHNKVMVIDGVKVITGSFNFTNAAQFKNAENVVIIQDEKLARAYAKNWRRRAIQSVAYNPVATHTSRELNLPRSPGERSSQSRWRELWLQMKLWFYEHFAVSFTQHGKITFKLVDSTSE